MEVLIHLVDGAFFFRRCFLYRIGNPSGLLVYHRWMKRYCLSIRPSATRLTREGREGGAGCKMQFCFLRFILVEVQIPVTNNHSKLENSSTFEV